MSGLSDAERASLTFACVHVLGCRAHDDELWIESADLVARVERILATRDAAAERAHLRKPCRAWPTPSWCQQPCPTAICAPRRERGGARPAPKVASS